MHEKDAVAWFEIPAVDAVRAAKFYETVLGCVLKREKMGPLELFVFPFEPPGVGGCVLEHPSLEPGAATIVYLRAHSALDEALARVAPAGGSIAQPKTALPEGMGFFAHLVDTEGNRVGLHGLR
jgi:predicted enzyme related to lactoylglutathione lyase